MTEEEQKEIQRVRRECDQHAAEEVKWMMGFCCDDWWRRRFGLAADGSSVIELLIGLDGRPYRPEETKNE